MTEPLPATGIIRPDYPEPLWVQAAQLIAREIADGRLSAGSRLPPERELCQQLGISRVTLRKALTRLVDDGLLSPSHGRGWYVAAARTAPATRDWPNSLESFSETAARMGLEASSRVLRASASPASLDDGERLSVVPGTPLFVLERVRMLGGMPIAVDVSRIPLQLAPELPELDFARESVYAVLERHGVELAHAESTIEAVAADAGIAGHLGLEPGQPVLVLAQLVRDGDERPVLDSTIRYAGDRYRLRTHFSRARSPRRR